MKNNIPTRYFVKPQILLLQFYIACRYIKNMTFNNSQTQGKQNMTHATRRPLNTNTLRNIEQVLNFLKAMCRPHAYDTDHTDFQSGKLRFAPATSSRHTTGASRTELEDMFGITRWESYVVLSHLQKANLIRQQKHGQHVAYCWQSLAEFVDRGNDPQDWDSGDTRLRGDYGPAFEVPHPLCQWHHDEIVISCDKVGNEYRWHYSIKTFRSNILTESNHWTVAETPIQSHKLRCNLHDQTSRTMNDINHNRHKQRKAYRGRSWMRNCLTMQLTNLTPLLTIGTELLNPRSKEIGATCRVSLQPENRRRSN